MFPWSSPISFGSDRLLRRRVRIGGPRASQEVEPTHGLAQAHSTLADDRVVGKALSIPTLFVCAGDGGGPRVHPCRRVQEALRGAGIEYGKVIAGHGSPIPLLRHKGSRDNLHAATGTRKLPTLKLALQPLEMRPMYC